MLHVLLYEVRQLAVAEDKMKLWTICSVNWMLTTTWAMAATDTQADSGAALWTLQYKHCNDTHKKQSKTRKSMCMNTHGQLLFSWLSSWLNATTVPPPSKFKLVSLSHTVEPQMGSWEKKVRIVPVWEAKLSSTICCWHHPSLEKKKTRQLRQRVRVIWDAFAEAITAVPQK